MGWIPIGACEGWGGIIPRVKEFGGCAPDEIGM